MLGTTFAQPSGYWTKPTSIQDINPEDIHGHIFMLSPDNRLVAYEYREGPPNDIAGTDPAFFQELIEHGAGLRRVAVLLGRGAVGT